MKREIYKQLLTWKAQKDRKPLVIKGARQIGKTWIIKEFGKHEYERFVYINCDSNEPIKDLFEHDFDIKRIVRGLSAVSGIDISSKNTHTGIDDKS